MKSYTILAAFLTLSVTCSPTLYEKEIFYFFNNSEKPVTVVINNKVIGKLKPNYRHHDFYPVNTYNIEFKTDDKIIFQKTIKVEKTEDTNRHVFNMDGEKNYALIDISGFYEGGGVLGAFNNKNFPITERYIGQKYFKIDARLKYINLIGDKIADSMGSFYTPFLLCDYSQDIADNDEKIIEHCLRHF